MKKIELARVSRRVAAVGSMAIALAMWSCSDDDDPAFDCGDFTTFDECREHAECQFIDGSPCEGSTGQSGCFTVSCDLCGGSGDNCTEVRGGDGADGCVNAVICPGVD